MKKQYTKKQIQEAIAYWQKQLDEKDILERGKQYDPYVNGPNLTNIQDLEEECHHFCEMGLGKTRLYINIDGRDVKLNNFGIEVEQTPRGNKAILYFNRKLDY